MRVQDEDQVLLEKLQGLPWFLLTFTFLLAGIGVLALYSATKGQMEPWAMRQLIFFFIGIFSMLVVALIPIRFWYMAAYFAYFGGLILLLLVHIVGVEGGLGAQRWLNIAGFQFQPSELAKVCLVLALARYFHRIHPNNLRHFTTLIIPAILIGIAVLLILKQPNLGTATITAIMSVGVMFMAGVGWKKFIVGGIVLLLALPVAWHHMHDYQKQRVYTFLEPERDPLGSGYNIIQSKVAIGSGGFWGRGFMKGTQSQLSFVPERHTDFIFSIIAEEFGFVGSLALLALYGLFVFRGMHIAMKCQSLFGKLVAYGVTAIIFLHVFVNLGMVSGILPVVGVPLPLISYGGSSMISTLIGIGFIANVYVHRKVKLDV